VTAMLHLVHFMMLFGVVVLNMVQLGLTMMLFSTAMKWVFMISSFVVMFHD
jgi:hypothetical protein